MAFLQFLLGLGLVGTALAAPLAPPGRQGAFPGAVSQSDPQVQAAVRKVQGWVDGVEGRLAEIVQASTLGQPEIITEPDGGRRLVFRVTVTFKQGFYDRFGQWQQEWPESMDVAAQRRVASQLARLNRFGIFLGLYNSEGDLIAKAPVVRNPYFANMLEDYYEDRQGDLVPVSHTQTFRDKPETIGPMLRRADLSALSTPAVFEEFRTVFKAESSTRKEVVISVAADDLSNARVYRLVMETTGN